MSGDRRADDEGRDRIDDLIERFETLAEGFEDDRKLLRRVVKGMVGALVVVVAAVVFGFAGDRSDREKLRQEGDVRKDQTCLLFERQHDAAVRQLVGLYHYLEGLTPRQRTRGINPAVIASMPQTEDDAQQSAAPVYCDARGVGLPEPNPRIPPRPPGIAGPPPPGAKKWVRRT